MRDYAAHRQKLISLNSRLLTLQRKPISLSLVRVLRRFDGESSRDLPHVFLKHMKSVFYSVASSSSSKSAVSFFRVVTPFVQRLKRFALGFIALGGIPFIVTNASAQTVTTLRTFTGGTTDGESTASSLVQDNTGTLYGVTSTGGANDRGILFKLQPDGSSYTVMFSFPSSAGSPRILNGRNNSFILGPDGVLYGASRFGGIADAGTVYKINRDGTGFTVLHSFTGTPSGGGNDGREPNGGLIIAADGNLYGCTSDGSGPGNTNRAGTIFRLSTNGSGYQVICNFLPSSAYPNSFGPVSLMQASDGKLYGAAIGGAPNNTVQLGSGSLFSLKTDGSDFKPIYFFTSSGTGGIGAAPESQLIQLSDGKLYGVARNGGTSLDGSLFRINPDGSSFQVLYSFPGGTTGEDPENNFFLSRDGTSFYGSTRFGGAPGIAGQGVYYKIRTDGTGYKVLYQKPTTGSTGYFGFLQASNGALYGSTLRGSPPSTVFGTIFRIDEASGPTITTQPSSATAALGGSVTLNVAATGATGYQWRRNGAAIAGATNASLTLSSLSLASSGNYDVVTTNADGSTVSATAILLINDGQPNRLSNLSVRTTLAANQILTVGFNVRGGSKPVLIRAAGPTLGAPPFNIPGTMADPKLAIFNTATPPVKIDENDNWGGNTAIFSTGAALGAFPFTNSASLDAAVIHNVDGGRTVQVSGPTAGNLIVEAYDTNLSASPKLVNLSARNFVGTGNDILTAGFNIAGTSPKNILIRAVGPSLAAPPFNIPGTMADPKLVLFNTANPPQKIDENDNYLSTLTGVFNSVGAFGLVPGAKDAVLMVQLPPGGYTVQISGADGGTGDAIVEVYELP